MPTIRIATFNAENLFARFRFKGKRVGKGRSADYVPWTKNQLAKIAKDGWLVDETFFDLAKPHQRRLTAAAIKATKADVLALQEIENLDVLRRFNAEYLRSHYPYHLLIDNPTDPRLIDVAILSRFPFGNIRTHQFARKGGSRIFSRDCLEVDMDLGGGQVLPIYVNHLKSMMGGRAKTAARRLNQAHEIVRILTARYGAAITTAPFVVLGDMNDYLDPPTPSPAITTLIQGASLVNVVERIPAPAERWTHFWAGGGEYRQLDYILLSQGLANANPTGVPEIVRAGLPRRATRYTGRRFSGVGDNEPKASDHCPVVVEIVVP